MAPSRMANVISLFHSATTIQILDFVNALLIFKSVFERFFKSLDIFLFIDKKRG